MTDAAPPVSSWRFPSTFWIANLIELFERAAYYGVFIALAVFLTSVVGYSDVQAGWIGAGFSALIYFLPFATGAWADRVGFRTALITAFALLAIGYALLGRFPTPVAVLLSLSLIALGGALVKPIITGTVARSSDAHNRARAYSLFYMMVNIGSFSGKTVARPVRVLLGVGAIPYYSAAAAAIALVVVVLFYWPDRGTTRAGSGAASVDGQRREAREVPSLRGLLTVLKNGRFVALILITAGFWMIQGQLYASMPKYVLRTVGNQASPEWYANINPFMVVLFVVPVTQLMRGFAAVTSIGVSLLLIPFSALAMGLSPQLGNHLTIFGYGVHPVTAVMVGGIALQGLAECFLSPRYLEFASKQAPPGQEGLYLGYAHLNTFFAWLTGFIASGYLLDAFCPDPAKLSAVEQAAHKAALASGGALPAAYAHAQYLWFVFASVGAFAFVLLVIFAVVTRERRQTAV